MIESLENFFLISCRYSTNFWAEVNVIKWLDNQGVKIESRLVAVCSVC